ncbi:MAG: hypothetical protein IEMM0008_1595 [bacterium]|nr:MAG: hypothetical protein IEMM0008_1595 [bacterium]
MIRFYLIIIALFISHNVFCADSPSNYPNYPRNNNYPPPPKKKDNGPRIVIDGGYFFPAEPSSGPALGYGFGIGYGGGIGIESKDRTMQIRLDLHYYKWTQGSNTYWRTPFFFGVRGFPSRRLKYVLPFFEFGYELSGDKETAGESDVHFGITPGAGLEFRFEPISFGVSARYHLIIHPYFTISPYLGFRF